MKYRRDAEKLDNTVRFVTDAIVDRFSGRCGRTYMHSIPWYAVVVNALKYVLAKRISPTPMQNVTFHIVGDGKSYIN